jgi:hypothetical protein
MLSLSRQPRLMPHRPLPRLEPLQQALQHLQVQVGPVLPKGPCFSGERDLTDVKAARAAPNRIGHAKPKWATHRQ